MSLRVAHVTKDGELEGERVLDARTCDCCPIAATRTSGGMAIAYRDRSDGGELRDISLLSWSPEGWSEPALVHEDGWEIAGCPVNGPALDADGEALAISWFTAAGGQPAVWHRGHSRAGFTEPERVDLGDPTGRVDLVLDGAVSHVSWVEADRLWVRVLSPGSPPSPAYELARLPPGTNTQC